MLESTKLSLVWFLCCLAVRLAIQTVAVVVVNTDSEQDTSEFRKKKINLTEAIGHLLYGT